MSEITLKKHCNLSSFIDEESSAEKRKSCFQTTQELSSPVKGSVPIL